jgi:hypothetical protein
MTQYKATNHHVSARNSKGASSVVFLEKTKASANIAIVKKALLVGLVIETSLQYSQEAIIRINPRAAENQVSFNSSIPAIAIGAKTSAVRALLMSITSPHCAHHSAYLWNESP